MNENIDLTKILDGCPEGTEFYSSNYGKVFFTGIESFEQYPILFRRPNVHAYCTKEGFNYANFEDAECTFFPSKNQRDWSKFVRFWDKSKVDVPKVEKFNVNTLQPFDKILVRDDGNIEWCCGLFSHFDSSREFPISTTELGYKWCIPYNEETKHLLGTTDDCPEYYKWWEE